MITRKDQLCLSNEKKGGKQTKSAEADDEAPRPKRKPAFKPSKPSKKAKADEAEDEPEGDQEDAWEDWEGDEWEDDWEEEGHEEEKPPTKPRKKKDSVGKFRRAFSKTQRSGPVKKKPAKKTPVAAEEPVPAPKRRVKTKSLPQEEEQEQPEDPAETGDVSEKRLIFAGRYRPTHREWNAARWDAIRDAYTNRVHMFVTGHSKMQATSMHIIIHA